MDSKDFAEALVIICIPFPFTTTRFLRNSFQLINCQNILETIKLVLRTEVWILLLLYCHVFLKPYKFIWCQVEDCTSNGWRCESMWLHHFQLHFCRVVKSVEIKICMFFCKNLHFYILHRSMLTMTQTPT